MKQLKLKAYDRVSAVIGTEDTAKDVIAKLDQNNIPFNERVVHFTNVLQVKHLTENTVKLEDNIGSQLLFLVSDNVEKDLPVVNDYVKWSRSPTDIVLVGDGVLTLVGEEMESVEFVVSDEIYKSPEIVPPEDPVVEKEATDGAFDHTHKPTIMDFLTAFKYMQTGGKVRRLGDPTHSVYGYQAGYTTPAMPGWGLPEGDHVVIEPQLVKQNDCSFDLSWRPSASDLEANNYISTKTHLLPVEFTGEGRNSSLICYELVNLPDPSKGTGALDDAMPIVTDESIRTVIIVTGETTNGGDLLACMLTDMRKNYLTPNWGCTTIFNDHDLGPWDTTVLNTVQLIASDMVDVDVIVERLTELANDYGRCGLVIDIHSIVEELTDKGMEYDKANEACVSMANYWAAMTDKGHMPGDFKLWIADLEEMRNQQGEYRN